MKHLPPHLTTTVVKAYSAVPSPSTSCLPFDRKLQGILKDKKEKSQFEETEQVSEPESDMIAMLELLTPEFKNKLW